MLDADAPAAAHADVAARVDGVAAQAALVEDRCRAVDRPALDEPRRIEQAACARVEVAVGLPVQLLAAREHVADVGLRVVQRELVAREPADLASVLVRAEHLVDEAEPVEHALDRLGRVAVAHLNHDGHPHRVLDVDGH